MHNAWRVYSQRLRPVARAAAPLTDVVCLGTKDVRGLSHAPPRHMASSYGQKPVGKELERKRQLDRKRGLRAGIKKQLAGLSEQDLQAQSWKAQSLVLNMPEYRAAKRIGIYLSMPKNEARTDALVADALWQRKEVFIPYVYALDTEHYKPKVMDLLELESYREYTNLEADGWRIPSLPREGIDERRNAMGLTGRSFETDGTARGGDERGDVGGLDVIVVPGVAFDSDMKRLGHGAGYYDKYLARYSDGGKRKKPYLVGLCLADQMLDKGKLVVDEWDWKVDAVACGNGTLLTAESQ